MTSLHWLTLTAVFTAVLWMPYVLQRFAALRIWGSINNPSESELEAQSEWAKRARRAHGNAVENLVVIAALVLAANAAGADDGLVATGALLFFGARVVHFVGHTASIPAVRTLAFLAGFSAQLLVAWAVFS